MALDLNDPTTWTVNVLPTQTGAVRYWVLADWERYAEVAEAEGNLTRIPIAVAWADTPAFKEYALGYAGEAPAPADPLAAAAWATAPPYLFRQAPLACPYAPNQYLTELRKLKVHAGAPAPTLLAGPGGAVKSFDVGSPAYARPSAADSSWPTFPPDTGAGMPARIVYEATFRQFHWATLDQPDFLALPRPSELLRNVVREYRVDARERKVSSWAFETYDPLNLPALGNVIPEVGFVPYAALELVYTWKMVPAALVPWTAILNCALKVNAAAFDFFPDGVTYGSYAAGALLFKTLASGVKPYIGPDGDFYYDLPYVFSLIPGPKAGTPNTWNLIPRNDGTWAPVRLRETPPAAVPTPLYQTADFEALFKPEPG